MGARLGGGTEVVGARINDRRMPKLFKKVKFIPYNTSKWEKSILTR